MDDLRDKESGDGSEPAGQAPEPLGARDAVENAA